MTTHHHRDHRRDDQHADRRDDQGADRREDQRDGRRDGQRAGHRPGHRPGHRHHLPAGSAARGPYALDIDPERAGWDWSSLRVLELEPGGTHTLATGEREWIVLPLAGGCTVRLANEIFELLGRESVFSGVTDFAYVPRDAHAQIASDAGGRFALAGAKCERRLPARYGSASEVPVELRGSGNCSRQVNNFAAADTFECDRLIAVEVLTPGGNWSSYPPHKHDEHRPGVESELEEIYYFEIDGPDTSHTGAAHTGAAHVGTAHSGPSHLNPSHPGAEGAGHGRDAVAYHRVTPSGPGGTDVLAEVRTGDTVLVPDGWHGPSIASPGHTLYYLNVMAGPGPGREWLISDHPDHGWMRDTWPTRPVDPRLPLYGPEASR
ncbi:5-deoxy-glucuronate isomerase [Streptomyces sp. AM 4-1-1]|uniref:5-deoxy-glucuronate isomerase n=1 Tax=Streptomyces sp. AM 4-1-1 TaxID=3028710 RepID=UPI0023B9F518|nr:5-deoxy-glucuronate isomerase [Streptomyces sp. AM 4-1-1]WEH33477.1 5-deoxy-glucuronate isomerase [Streptomyces sp. AM 4-1-1]